MVARNKALDVLRAIAVFMTFGRHMAKPEQENLPGIVYKVLRMWEKTGWAGVSLFFVLSGYLVSSLMFNEFQNTGGSIQFARFYIRRGLKIYPAFYALLITSLLLCVADIMWIHRGDLLPQEPVSTHIILSEIFFVQNYFGYIWVHVWSLAVEEHFYITLGLVIFGIMKFVPLIRPDVDLRDRFKPIVWLCGIVFVTCLALRYVYVTGQERTMDERFAGSCYTHLRIDSLFFGVLLAYFAKFRGDTFLVWVKRHTLWLLALGLLLISPCVVFEETDTPMMFWGYSSMFMGFGCLLLFALYHPWKSYGWIVERSTDFLAYIGQNSYSIYLWHFPVMYILSRFMKADGTDYYTLIAAQNGLGLVVGLIMAKLIEMPVLKIRDEYFKPTKALSAGVPDKA
ncbi:MAG: acyltransferase [Planctomycetota bacterium]